MHQAQPATLYPVNPELAKVLALTLCSIWWVLPPQAESCTKLASRGAAVMCHQAPAFRSGAAAHAHYTREHLTALISQVNTHITAAGGAHPWSPLTLEMTLWVISVAECMYKPASRVVTVDLWVWEHLTALQQGG